MAVTAQDVLTSINEREGVSVTQMCGRLGVDSRAKMRRLLQQLVRDGHLASRPRGGVQGGRTLYWRTDGPVGLVICV